jgi:myosin heavy subunit
VAGECLLARNPVVDYGRQHNLVEMDILNEAEIFGALRHRYVRDQTIYTYVGSTLVSLNPFQRLDIYGKHHINAHKAAQHNARQPHIYETGQLAEASLRSSCRNQGILITGESGAGKTEALKYLIEYLCYEPQGRSLDINDRIIDCNPILEAFGNAKTSRNSNSSRFGKYIKIYYSGKHVCGASIDSYLLEKTRVVAQSAGESNFHIFSMVINNLDQEQRKQYKLCAQPYALCLNLSQEDENTPAKFHTLLKLLRDTGFSDGEVDDILRVLAAILNLGQVSFAAAADEHTVCPIQSEANARNFAELLQADYSSVADTLTSKRITVGGEQIRIPLKQQECQNVAKGLCKNIYEALFDFIVGRLNENLNPASPDRCLSVGLLDIFGFESFQRNSLEQLFINYANEKLQQIYTGYVFKSIRDDLLAEQVGAEYLDCFGYTDNAALISALQRPPEGLFEILNDSCSLGKDDDESFLNKLRRAAHKNPAFSFDRKAKLSFAVNHSAARRVLR